MAGRLAIDFGTSNTLLALWDDARGEGVPVHLPDYGRPRKFRQGDRVEEISLIPSVIHVAGKRRWLGQQVLARDLYDSPHTFRWMKRSIANRHPGKVVIDGRPVSAAEAGQDFLATILRFALAECRLGDDEEVALTVPVESFEHYEDWLTGVTEQAGVRRYRLIDEPSAAALGYGMKLRAGHAYLVFDFGGGTLDVAVVLVEDDTRSRLGQRCRVLGKAGTDLGGSSVDAMIFSEILTQAGRSDADEDVRPVSRALLVECERAKEALSFQDHADVRVDDPASGLVIAGRLTQARLEQVLDQHDTFARVDRTVRRALAVSREQGYDIDDVTAVLMVGGSSLIPSVQRTVQRIFGRERVLLQRPLDAVVRGAASFIAGVNLVDHVQHDYAVRYVDQARGEYAYRPIVPKGTVYPSEDALARLTVRASHEGQSQLGLAIFELGDQAAREPDGAMELVFDPGGAARLSHVSPEEHDRRYYFWVNEHNPTFLHADPPAARGEARFEVEFRVDANKRLLLTATDLRTRRVTLRNHPVVKLT